MVSGQKFDVNVDEQFASEDGVYLNYEVEMQVSLNKAGEPEAWADKKYVRYYPNARAQFYTEDYIYHSHFHNVEQVSVFQYDLLSSGKYKKIRIAEVDTVKPFSSSIFYDDLVSLKYKFPGIREKSITEMNYREIITDYHFFGDQNFASYFPIVKGHLELKVNKDIEIAFQEHRFEGYDIQFSERFEGKNKVYRWDLKDIPSLRPTSGSKSYLSLSPNVTFQIVGYVYKGKYEQVLPDTNKMYEWYYSKVDTVMEGNDDSLRKFTETLVNDQMSDFEKVKTIYYWVQRNIKYIAIEYGEGGIVPRPPHLVYSRRYGDCKDMACLTKKMISFTGIQANLVWIGTRSLPYRFSEVPSPVVANHMICAYRGKDGYFFLDATATSNPINFPSSGIQGKEALIEKGKDKYEIVEVPIMESAKSGKVDSCLLKVEGKKLTGDCKCKFYGYKATSIRQYKSYQLDGDDRSFYSELLSKGNNRFKLKSFEVEDFDDFDKAISVSYNFEIDEYVQQIDNEYIINLNIDQYLRGHKYDREEYKYDIERDYKFVDVEVNTLEIPKGMSVESIPSIWKHSTADYSFNIDYLDKAEEGQLKMRRKIVLDYLEYPVHRFKEWNASIDLLNQNYKKTLVMLKDE